MITVRICTASGCDIVVQTVLDPNAVRPSDPLSPVTDFTILSGFEEGDPPQSSAPSTTVVVKDDFWGGDFTSGNIGDLGWISDSLTMFPAISQPNHPGMVGAYSLGQLGSFTLTPINSAPLLGDWFFDVTFVVFMLISTPTNGIRIGLTSTPSSLSTSGIYFEKIAADTNFFGVARTGLVQETRVDTLVSTFPSWHTFRIRRINSDQIGFTIDGGGEVTVESNIPTNGLTPTVQMDGLSGIQAVFFDYFSAKIYDVIR